VKGVRDMVGDDYLSIVGEIIKNINYGTITVVIQDGKIVQIEKNEKIRVKNNK
jgi:hypothetical protein